MCSLSALRALASPKNWPTMARHGLRTRPPGGDPRAADGDEEEDADGDGRRIPSVPIPHHTHILLARARAPYSPPRLRNGSFAHASRSGGQRNFLELQALHPAQPPAPVLYSDCTLLYTGRSLDPRNITGAQRASSARSVSPLVCSSDCVPASPPYACSSPSHANRSTGQRNTTQSSTVLARPVCPHVCDSDRARATTPFFFSPCGALLPPSLLLAHNLTEDTGYLPN